MRAFWLFVVLVVCVCGDEVKERLSVRKCKEYGQYLKKPCVIDNENKSILAGSTEFPHMAALGHGTEDDKEWICSGSLISDQYVLSVAHCATSVPVRGAPKWIRLGAADLTSTNNSSLQDYNISEMIKHPNYTRQIGYNDIVLFKLDRPVEFNDYIRPACLASSEEEIEANEKFIVSGWGEEEGEPHKHLKKDERTKVTNAECNTVYESVASRRLPQGVRKDVQICASPSQTKACHIKSGAPLQYHNKEENCTYLIAGLLSTGLRFCGNTPDIYTYIPGYLDWIESIVWPQST